MKRGTMVCLAALMFAGASAANAQYVFAGGGASLPIGDFKDSGGKTGWTITAGIGYDIGSKGLFVEAEGFYASHKYTDSDFTAKPLTVLGAVGYSFMPDKKVSPYVLAGAGIMSTKLSEGGESHPESQFAYSGAAGLSFKLGQKASFWIEGRLLGSKDAKMIPVTAGVTLNFGKSSM
jgi:opacity protein-like surface antigen